MKKVILLAVFLACVFQMNMFGQTQIGNRNFGLGLEFGNYPGITGKLWTSDITAFSAGLGFGSFTQVHLDYLWHDFNAFKVNEGRLPLYYGFGGIINTYNSAYANATADFGVRGTFGLAYIFKDNNFDIFFELSPTLRLSLDSGLFLSGSVGVRYFFL